MGDHGKIKSKHKLLSKKVNFFQLETNLLEKKGGGVGVSGPIIVVIIIIIIIFMLGHCATTKF